MTDRELLELAAEAYGAGQYPEFGEWEYFFTRTSDDEFATWNPLCSIYDALNLAKNIKCVIVFDNNGLFSEIDDVVKIPYNQVFFQDYSDNIEYDVCRAITNAAADYVLQMRQLNGNRNS